MGRQVLPPENPPSPESGELPPPSWLLISNGPTLEDLVKSAVSPAPLPVVLNLAILR